MKKYKAIIYDIDGTILDTLKMNLVPLMRIIEEETGSKVAYEELFKYASLPGLKILKDLKIKDVDKVYARWVKYVNEYEEEAQLFDGFKEVFTHFNGKLIQAIVSAKMRPQYQIDMVEKGFDKYIQVAILAEDTTKQKPDPEPLFKCLKEIAVSPDEALFIGDAFTDYQAANRAKVDFGYATWGSVSGQGIDNPTYIFNHPLELLKLID